MPSLQFPRMHPKQKVKQNTHVEWKLTEKKGYLLMIKLWKCCMSDEDGSATAFVMQWRWPIKYRHRHYSQLSVTFSWLTTRKTAFSRPWNRSRATLTGNSPVTVRTQHRAFLETTVGHFVDHWPLQQWSRSAHLVKQELEGQKPRPLDEWNAIFEMLQFNRR